jgi:hypothetical protein
LVPAPRRLGAALATRVHSRAVLLANLPVCMLRCLRACLRARRVWLLLGSLPNPLVCSAACSSLAHCSLVARSLLAPCAQDRAVQLRAVAWQLRAVLGRCVVSLAQCLLAFPGRGVGAESGRASLRGDSQAAEGRPGSLLLGGGGSLMLIAAWDLAGVTVTPLTRVLVTPTPTPHSTPWTRPSSPPSHPSPHLCLCRL